MMKDRGETVVEHTWFVLISLATLFYAPFWLSKSLQLYEDQVQDAEIAEIEHGAQRALECMSLSYRSASQNNSTANLSHQEIEIAQADLEAQGQDFDAECNDSTAMFEDISARGSIASSVRPRDDADTMGRFKLNVSKEPNLSSFDSRKTYVPARKVADRTVKNQKNDSGGSKGPRVAMSHLSLEQTANETEMTETKTYQK